MRNDRDTIAAIATAQGEGGIAIVRVSGPGALKALEAVFTRQPAKTDHPDSWQPNRLYYGHLMERGRRVDEAMAVYMAAPRSYTREDVCELHVHGGRYAAEKALQLVLNQGVRAAEPGEFTLRAFLNGRIDLSQAEAVMAMISASGEVAARAALREPGEFTLRAFLNGRIDLSQAEAVMAMISASGEVAARAAMRELGGALARFVDEVSRRLTDLLALSEAGVDFPEEVDERATRERLEDSIRGMIRELEAAVDENAARIVREGLTVALAGVPNAGKSSLMNAILRADRAIVTPVPGTTRDVLSERVRVKGLDMTLLDTAGIRETRDEIELQGVLRAKKAVESADQVILVVDGSIPEGEAESALLKAADGRTMVVLSKCDLGVDPGRRGLRVSAKTGEGLDELLDELKARADSFGAGEAFLTRPRHIDCAKRAISSLSDALSSLAGGVPQDLISVDLMAALSALGEITGRSASDEVISAVFRNFCVGK